MLRGLADYRGNDSFRNGPPDYFLAAAVFGLMAFGILILNSVSATISYDKFGNTSYFLKHQLLWGVIPGLILAFVVSKLDLNFIKKWSPLLLLANLILMGMVFLPGGYKFGGAHRWLNLGPISFQPSEFLKLSFILYLSAWLASKTEKSRFHKTKKESPKTLKTLIAFLAVLGLVSFSLIIQKDVSTFAIVILIGSIIYFSAGAPLLHLGLLLSVVSTALIFLIRFEPYRLSRILVILGENISPMREGYQLKQALISIGSGGIFGVGLGLSRQRFGFLPESMSDAIFPILAEETGLAGAAVLILLFLAVFIRGFKIIKGAPDEFLRLTALGISCWIVSQAFVNIASMTGILPIVGIPLPLISYGASHLVSELIGIGILLNISRTI